MMADVAYAPNNMAEKWPWWTHNFSSTPILDVFSLNTCLRDYSFPTKLTLDLVEKLKHNLYSNFLIYI